MNSDRALNIDNQKIKKTEQIKLLGSYINEYLNFAGHISNLCTKSNQKVGVLVYGCNLIPCNTKLTLYKSAILSHLTYWLLVWNFCKSYNSRKIVRVQEGALHAIYISKMETYKELLAHARLPTLNNRHLQHNATLMYKVKNNLVPSCLRTCNTASETGTLKYLVLTQQVMVDTQ